MEPGLTHGIATRLRCPAKPGLLQDRSRLGPPLYSPFSSQRVVFAGDDPVEPIWVLKVIGQGLLVGHPQAGEWRTPEGVFISAFGQKIYDRYGQPPGSRVLDAGAGSCLYANHFSQHRYESADYCKGKKEYGDVSYVCSLEEISVRDESFDLVLSTQVLGHVAEPLLVLREIHRVLKPGGRLWLSAPLSWEEHGQPADFYRYTQFGLRHLLTQAGFKVVELEWGGRYYATLWYQLRLAVRSLSFRPKHYGGGPLGLLSAVCVAALWPWLYLGYKLFTHLELRHKYTEKGFCLNYFVVGEKTARGQGP